MNVTVYTQNECPPCQIVKMFLSEYGFSFSERNIDLDSHSKKELIEVYQSSSTPTIIVDDEVIRGFDLEKLKNALKIAE